MSELPDESKRLSARYDALFDAFSGDPNTQEVVARLIEFERLVDEIHALSEGRRDEPVVLDQRDATLLFEGMQEAIEAALWPRWKRLLVRLQEKRLLTRVKRGD